jgi:PAS domain S-box-containing protein
VKEPPKVRALSNGRTNRQAIAAPVTGYGQHASPLPDVLFGGESDHNLIVAGTGSAVFTLDPNGCVASWNTGAQEIEGYSHEEILGKHFSVFYPPDDRAHGKPERDLVIAARDGRFADEGMRIRKDGSQFRASIVLSAVRDRADRLRAFVKVVRDLTDHLAAQERGLSDAEALMAANTELEAFTYSVSHDLRAPIRQIEGFAQILSEHLGENLDPQAEQYLRRIQGGARQMGRLVDDLLYLAQLGRQRAKLRRVSLDDLVAPVVANLRANIGDREIEWRVGPLPALVCDPGLMQVVFTNLLSNAVKYTGPRAKAVIEIGHTVIDGRTVIYVRDNGIGFDMKYADKLFGVFQRLHSAEDFEGAGVGLATVQRIISKHRGTVWAEAAPDSGTTFFFSLGGNAAARTAQPE